MTFGLITPMLQLNRAVRLVALSSVLGNVINDSLPKLDLKTSFGGIKLGLTNKDLITPAITDPPPELVKISREIEGRLDQLQETIEKQQRIFDDSRTRSSSKHEPQVVQVIQPHPVYPPQVQVLPVALTLAGHPVTQGQHNQQHQPMIIRLMASSENSGVHNPLTHPSLASSAMILFQNRSPESSFINHGSSAAQLLFQGPIMTGPASSLSQSNNHQSMVLYSANANGMIGGSHLGSSPQVVPIVASGTSSNAGAPVLPITMENLTAALTAASFQHLPSSQTMKRVSMSVDPRTTNDSVTSTNEQVAAKTPNDD